MKAELRAWMFSWCVAFIFAMSALSVHAQERPLFVSIPSLRLAKGERVVGFEIGAKAARIASIPNTPMGWSISVDNDPSWSSTVKAGILVGAAAVDPLFFRKFLTIEKDESLSVPFSMGGVVFVTKDFAKTRQIKLSQGDFLLQPIPQATPRSLPLRP